MTEVPEHLLRRAKAARDKAAGGTGDAGGPEAPAAAAQASASEPGTEVATTAAAAAPAVVEEPAAPVPPYVDAALRRRRVPKFAIPVLASLPVWALVYAGTLTKPAGPSDPELALGQSVYAANCASCHGSGGEGGTGRPLGDVMKTFPNKADHIAWVHLGSPAAGTPYGDPSLNRKAGEGGYTKMPPFKDSLSDAEIAAVVRYEREQFGGSDPEPSTEEDLNASGKTTAASGHGASDGGGTSGAQSSGGNVGGTSETSSDSTASTVAK